MDIRGEAGFLFLAPTQKVSKSTGEIASYKWLVAPDLTHLALGDDSGFALAELVRAAKAPSVEHGAYDGPAYDDLTDDQRREADNHIEVSLFDWSVRLAVASNWPDGERDEKGRGWEALSRDFAWALARLATCPWTRLAEDAARDLYDEMLPSVIADDPRCRGKWRSDLLAKANSKPADLPPWLQTNRSEHAVALSSLFDKTATLRTIRDAAHSRAVSAPVVLANVLGLVLLTTDVRVVLPPVVGSSASLNLGFALVGESGATKTTSAEVARQVLGIHLADHWVRAVGSGEGLIDAYYRWVPKNPDNEDGPKVLRLAEEHDRRCLIMVDEGEMLAKQSARPGATLPEYLRTSLTGGLLGATNRKTGTAGDRSVPSKSYRLVSVVNVHPAHADVLLHGESTGYPQRFLWMPTSDPTLPTSVEDLPDWPGSLDWVPPDLLGPDAWAHDEVRVDYPDEIQREVRQKALDRAHGRLQAREGHAILTRLKVALALALLHDEGEITQEWWEMAGLLSDVSLSTQDECLALMATQRQSSENRKATVSARAQDAAEDDRLTRAVSAVVERLRKRPGEELPWREAKPNSRLLRGIDTEDVIEGLRTQVGITVVETTSDNGGPAWRLTYRA